VGIVHALVVFVTVLVLYRLITWLTGKSSVVEKFLEGKTECLVDEGKFSMQKFKRESLGQEEFFTELRLRNVDHLGQIKKAYLETTGDISVFFYADDEVKPGLPILPELFSKQFSFISDSGTYCCCKCGEVIQLSPGNHTCTICHGKKWVLPIQIKRISFRNVAHRLQPGNAVQSRLDGLALLRLNGVMEKDNNLSLRTEILQHPAGIEHDQEE
jgi:uncharacterized membrane protein YcaP (DUF421 family)